MAAIQQITDLPESLLVSCLAFFLDKEKSGGLRTEAQLCYMSMLLGRPFSEPLAEHEVTLHSCMIAWLTPSWAGVKLVSLYGHFTSLSAGHTSLGRGQDRLKKISADDSLSI